jgi:hypothetical protein
VGSSCYRCSNLNAKPVVNVEGHLRKAIKELHGILRDVILPGHLIGSNKRVQVDEGDV